MKTRLISILAGVLILIVGVSTCGRFAKRTSQDQNTSPVATQELPSLEIGSHASLYGEKLAKAGVVADQEVYVDDAVYRLSKPFALDESHQIAVAWVSAGGEESVRVLYRSNSQCNWRLCDATTPSHIGKGFHEYDKEMPIDVSIALLESSEDVGHLKPWFQVESDVPSQYELAWRLLRLLTIDYKDGIEAGTVVALGGNYVTREYASMMADAPRAFSIVNGHIKTARGEKVASPDATELPKPGQLPDYSILVNEVVFRNPAYAKSSKTDGMMTGRVFLSHDKQVKYFFIEDEKQRAMLACVELTSAEICALGLRSEYLNVEGMNIPLIEYGLQIPKLYGGKLKGDYQLNWDWVRRLPIIRDYYRGIGREIPPLK